MPKRTRPSTPAALDRLVLLRDVATALGATLGRHASRPPGPLSRASEDWRAPPLAPARRGRVPGVPGRQALSADGPSQLAAFSSSTMAEGDGHEYYETDNPQCCS